MSAELHDGFQDALRRYGRIKVTHEHPRLPDVLARARVKIITGSWKERSEGKTHFVLIDFSGVHYEIRTRQYDGTIGRASPVVRSNNRAIAISWPRRRPCSSSKNSASSAGSSCRDRTAPRSR